MAPSLPPTVNLSPKFSNSAAQTTLIKYQASMCVYGSRNRGSERDERVKERGTGRI